MKKAKLLLINANFSYVNSEQEGSLVVNPFSIQLWLETVGEATLNSFTTEDNLQCLNYFQMIDFAKNVFEFLKSDGRWRIAVPDRNNLNFIYWMRYKPNGLIQKLSAIPAQSYWDLNSLTELLRQIGFIVYPLEYFDENGQFVKNDWDIKDGLIEHRSGNTNKTQYLIIDAVKP